MEEDFDSNIGFLVHDVARLMRTMYDRRMAPLGLTRSQWWVLNHLYFNEGISQTEFASVLDIEKATVGRLLDRLEAKGWVARKNDPQDKRTKRVYLTKKVQPTLQIMRDMAAVTRDEAVRSLNKTERKQLRNMLKRMRDDLSEMTNATSTSELA
ncbi:MAG: MarR family transcriptional regulator [Alphaproteobacteria bacterium]|nr:MarR family transcriptional regulator [Alphaproteobacteria bacterium]